LKPKEKTEKQYHPEALVRHLQALLARRLLAAASKTHRLWLLNHLPLSIRLNPPL